MNGWHCENCFFENMRVMKYMRTAMVIFARDEASKSHRAMRYILSSKKRTSLLLEAMLQGKVSEMVQEGVGCKEFATSMGSKLIEEFTQDFAHFRTVISAAWSTKKGSICAVSNSNRKIKN